MMVHIVVKGMLFVPGSVWIDMKALKLVGLAGVAAAAATLGYFIGKESGKASTCSCEEEGMSCHGYSYDEFDSNLGHTRCKGDGWTCTGISECKGGKRMCHGLISCECDVPLPKCCKKSEEDEYDEDDEDFVD